MSGDAERKFLSETCRSETLWERRIGACDVTRRELRYPDGSVQYTVLRPKEEARIFFEYDEGLVEKGIVPGAGGWLIDQKKTLESLGRPAGEKPELFLEPYSDGSIAVCPSNFGWQRGLGVVERGRVVLIKNDRTEGVSGDFSGIGWDGKRWGTFFAELKEGVLVNPGSLSEVEIGFSLPPILREGEIVPLTDVGLAGHPRLVADSRNAFDLSGGVQMSREDRGVFFEIIRNWLPEDPSVILAMARGEEIVVNRPGLPREEMERLAVLIDRYQMPHLSLDPENRALLIRRLPLNRIPVVGIGFDEKGQLIIAAADGYHPQSRGLTIEELAWVMRCEGAVTAGLGSAGGDVPPVAKIGGGFELLSLREQTRPVPSVLIISPPT